MNRNQLTTPPTPRLFNQDMAAAYLGISSRHFERQWRKYIFPQPLRIGRRLLWDRKMLDLLVDILSDIEEGAKPEPVDEYAGVVIIG